jgi:DHA1 family tetracycline resistance protein-like MFS transporter
MTRRSPLAVIFLAVFLDLLGFGIVLPLAAYYVGALGGNGMSVAEVATFSTWLGAIYSFTQFLFAPLWGRLSDRVGRRPVILVSVAGSCLSYVLFGLATSLPVLLFSRALAGAMAANISTAQAYVADVTTPEERTKGMGMIGAAIGLGFVLGPAIGAAVGGTHTGQPSAAVPFLAAGLAGLNLVLAFFLLPESLKRGAEWRSWSLAAYQRALSHPRVGLPILMFFLSTLAFAAMEWTLTPFLMHRFAFSQRDTGTLFFGLGLIIAFVQGGLVRRLAKGGREPALLVVGTLLMVPGLALIPVAPSVPALWGALSLLAFGQAIVSPSTSSLISQSTAATEQGAILGVSQGMSSLARAIGPLAGGALIAAQGSVSVAFPAAALVMGLAFLLSLRILAGKRGK